MSVPGEWWVIKMQVVGSDSVFSRFQRKVYLTPEWWETNRRNKRIKKKKTSRADFIFCVLFAAGLVGCCCYPQKKKIDTPASKPMSRFVTHIHQFRLFFILLLSHFGLHHFFPFFFFFRSICLVTSLNITSLIFLFLIDFLG